MFWHWSQDILEQGIQDVLRIKHGPVERERDGLFLILEVAGSSTNNLEVNTFGKEGLNSNHSKETCFASFWIKGSEERGTQWRAWEPIKISLLRQNQPGSKNKKLDDVVPLRPFSTTPFWPLRGQKLLARKEVDGEGREDRIGKYRRNPPTFPFLTAVFQPEVHPK